ncbi:hypothetical protein ACWGDX_24015 [Streptomyces sp. NPDC055025]
MSDFDTWIKEHRAVGEQLAPAARLIHNALADFCENHRAWPRLGLGHFIDLWGFGEVPVVAEAADGTGHWLHLPDLMTPTGVDYPTLRHEFDRDTADDYGDIAYVTWPGDNGGLHLVKHTFAMRIFAGESPWAKEFWANTKDILRLGMLHSGLADTLGMADVIREDGPLPSVEVAQRQAMSGPLGALDTGSQP